MRVRVINKNVHDHVEKFKGEIITIPSMGSIEMGRDDAVLFLGQYFAMKKGSNGLQTSESKKILSLEPILDVKAMKKEAVKTEEHVCNACGFVAKSSSGLKAHVKANHAHQMIDDEARENL